MARVFSGSGNTQARTNLELAVAGLITMNGGTPAPAMMDRIMRDVADRVSLTEILSASPTMLAQADGLVKSALGLGDPANANKLAAAKSAEADTATNKHVSLVDELRKRAQLAQTETSNGLPNGRRSSAQFGDLKDASNQDYVAARDLARQYGMGWAAENPDLLRLGTSAIRALHEGKLGEQSFKTLKKDAGYEAKDVVNFAKQAKKIGKNGDEMTAEYMAEINAIKAIDPKLAKQVTESDKAILGVLHDDKMSPADKSAKLKALGEDRHKVRDAAPPEARKHIDRTTDDVLKIRGALDSAMGVKAAENNLADSKVATKGSVHADELAMFGTDTAQPDSPKPNEPSAETKDTKQAAVEPARPDNKQVAAVPPKKPASPAV